MADTRAIGGIPVSECASPEVLAQVRFALTDFLVCKNSSVMPLWLFNRRAYLVA